MIDQPEDVWERSSFSPLGVQSETHGAGHERGGDETNVLFEVSALVSEQALAKLSGPLAAMRADSPNYRWYYPATLVRAAEDPEAIAYFTGPGQRPVDAYAIEDTVRRLELDEFAAPSGAYDEYPELLERFRDIAHVPLAGELLFEQWFFLMHRSFIVARLKRAFKAFTDAGAVGVEVLNRLVEARLDPAFRRTLKKDEGALTTLLRLRALGKWVAAGGPPAVGLVNPAIGAAVGGAAGIFLLFDP